jgi:hypothetical protein
MEKYRFSPIELGQVLFEEMERDGTLFSKKEEKS